MNTGNQQNKTYEPLIEHMMARANSGRLYLESLVREADQRNVKRSAVGEIMKHFDAMFIINSDAWAGDRHGKRISKVLSLVTSLAVPTCRS